MVSKKMLLVALVMALSACSTVNRADNILTGVGQPPEQFQRPVKVLTEFRLAETVPARCIKLGVRTPFLEACANTEVVIMPTARGYPLRGAYGALLNQYEGPPRIMTEYLDGPDLARRCYYLAGEAFAFLLKEGGVVGGCWSPGLLVLPHPCEFVKNPLQQRTEPYAALLCHELGHAAGWPPSHNRKAFS